MITKASRSAHRGLSFRIFLALAVAQAGAAAASKPEPRDVVLRDFRFTSGQTLPEVRMHCVTFGTPQRDAKGVVRNAVLVLHGTTGSSAQTDRNLPNPRKGELS